MAAIWRLLFLFLGVFVCATVARAGPVLSINADTQLDLAESFFDQADYQQAIAEYHTFLYFFPDDPRAICAEYKISLAWFKRRQYEKALEGFEAIAVKKGDDISGGIPLEARVMASRCYLAKGDLFPAVANLECFLTADYSDNEITGWVYDRIHYALAWVYLEGVAEVTADSLERAVTHFDKISPGRRMNAHLEDLSAVLDAARFSPDGLLASQKNPVLAGSLAVFPGAGYAYCNRYHDAAMAFLFNTAMIYAAWEAFDEGHDALGAVISLVELGFYTGSIYGSITAAHKYNRHRTSRFLEQLKPLRVGFSPGVGDGGVMCFLQMSF